MKQLLWMVILCAVGSCMQDRREGVERMSLRELDQGALSSMEGAEQYGRAAQQAAHEGLLGAERLFEALSYSEHVHELRFVEAILQLGGSYTPPQNLYVKVETTEENLREAMRPTRLRHPSERVKGIERVIDEGNRYAARLLIRYAAADNRRLRLLASYERSEELSSLHFLVCPQCGYLCEERFKDPYCPQCYLSESFFKRF
uniref:rubrerythrin family protein n=1 Tax=Alistipes sp. TaxID=1872444 RepID=UPI0040575B44